MMLERWLHCAKAATAEQAHVYRDAFVTERSHKLHQKRMCDLIASTLLQVVGGFLMKQRINLILSTLKAKLLQIQTLLLQRCACAFTTLPVFSAMQPNQVLHLEFGLSVPQMTATFGKKLRGKIVTAIRLRYHAKICIAR